MENKEIIPIGDRILVQFPPMEKKVVNGLVHIEQIYDYMQKGTVIAIGAGRFGRKGKRVPIECQPGDEVYIKKFAGIQVKFDGEQFLMCFEEDVEAVFHEQSQN